MVRQVEERPQGKESRERHEHFLCPLPKPFQINSPIKTMLSSIVFEPPPANLEQKKRV